MPSHMIVTREEWRQARKAHLGKEKEFTRLRDRLSAERRALPWVRVDKPYVFEGPSGKATLADLFDGRRQLIVYHFNFAPREFPSEEAPGLSVFYKDEHGEVFHTYSSYARGLDLLVGAYNYLDLVPKGRDEDALAFTMAWVRHHDRYGDRAGSERSRG